MEQAVSLPAYMQLSTKLEQQLSSYQLGTRLEAYRQGPINRKAWRNSIMAFIVFVALGIAGFILTFEVGRTTGYIPMVLPLFTSGAFLFAIFLAGMLLRGTLSVCVHSEGVVYVRNGHMTVWYWPQIADFQVVAKKSSLLGTRGICTIRSQDGKILKFKGNPLALDNLIQVVREKRG